MIRTVKYQFEVINVQQVENKETNSESASPAELIDKNIKSPP